jgi:hypothetical protein
MKLSQVALLFLSITVLGTALIPASYAEPYEVPKPDQTAFRPIDSGELIDRYPKGKKWRSLSIFRGRGTGSSSKWGLKGETEFIITSRYSSQFEVLNQAPREELSEIEIKCEILEASTSKIFTKTRLRLSDFSTGDPLFDALIRQLAEKAKKIHPVVQLLISAGKILEGADPNLEKTLTFLAKSLGISPKSLANTQDLQILESAKHFEGRTFVVLWTNGYGVTSIEEVLDGNSDRRPLDQNELEELAVGADPLAELYVFPSLSKKKGDRWNLDASQASPIFMGMGDAETDGQIRLRYTKDGKFGKESVRSLLIEDGDVEAKVKDGGDEIQLGIESMSGEIRVSAKDGMLLMGNGRGRLIFERISKDHLFFKARISRDLTSEWRYEATRVGP